MPLAPAKCRLWSMVGGRVGLWLGVATAAGLVAGHYYLRATKGPLKSSAQPMAMDRGAMNAEQRRMSDDIREAERKFQLLSVSAPGGAEAEAILAGAVERQKYLLSVNSHAGLEQNVRLERLVTARDTVRALAADRQIGELQEGAEAELKAGRPEVALEKIRAALQLQCEINNSGAEARAKNLVRERGLVQAIETAEAEPVAREFAAALQQARTAVAAERWSEALAALGRARATQARINRDFARTRFTNRPVLDEIDAEIASLDAAGLAVEIDACLKRADTAADQGRAKEAAGRYQAGADLQRKLNRQHPRSRFVSTARIAECEVRRQTVLAAEKLAAAAALDRQAAVALRKRQVRVADGKIGEAMALLAEVEKDFPKTRNFDGGLKIRLAYLKSRHAGLRALQDRVYERLVPLPDQTDRLMLRTETPQEIYTKVMSLNPSRHPGPALPVDSVNWHDAQEFCRRLSWLLGARVRLPTEPEFRVALGDDEVGAWSAETAAGRSQEIARQPANETGFYDLAGNVAEWLQPDADGAAKAVVAGGSYLDPLAELRKVPLVAADKHERARHVGFRFVVELALE